MSAPRILLFDSGMGGLTVARAVRDTIPEAELVYSADNAAFPYGAWSEPDLVRRVVMVMGRLLERVEPDIVVVACNTASVIALAALRQAHGVPFVGTVPAIKPAAQVTKTGLIGVLATPATAKREYTYDLIHQHAFDCRVFLHGARNLAAIAEAKLRGTPPDREELLEEIAPVYRRRDGKATDVVVLGCTHYPLLLDELAEAGPWPVTFIDPAPAIARRAADVLKTVAEKSERGSEIRGGTVILTSAEKATPAAIASYASMGFGTLTVYDLTPEINTT
jgi:glutamate racemase